MIETIKGMFLVIIAFYFIKFLISHIDYKDNDDDDGPGGSTGNPFM